MTFVLSASGKRTLIFLPICERCRTVSLLSVRGGLVLVVQLIDEDAVRAGHGHAATRAPGVGLDLVLLESSPRREAGPAADKNSKKGRG